MQPCSESSALQARTVNGSYLVLPLNFFFLDTILESMPDILTGGVNILSNACPLDDLNQDTVFALGLTRARQFTIKTLRVRHLLHPKKKLLKTKPFRLLLSNSMPCATRKLRNWISPLNTTHDCKGQDRP